MTSIYPYPTRAAYPSTPSYANDLEFVTAYLTVHMLSDASRIYTYIFWIAIAAVCVVCSILFHLNFRGGYLGALWAKWALRRRTWRKKHSLAVAKARGEPHRQPYSLPPNVQILTFVLITVASLLAAFLGPDYLAPGSTLWTLQKFPYAAVTYAKRDGYDMSAYFKYQPQYTIPKAWWTTGGRTGLIAFALFPLCILFALKSPPFAIFSVPCLLKLYCDKLLWLHKWTAVLIYLFTVLHVAFWSVQLCIESRNGHIAYTYAWQYQKFLFAWTAFGCMTLLFLTTIPWFRRNHYEAFWFLHVLLVPMTIVMAGLHHPPVWWWCWAALGLWLGERAWRFTWWLYTNGYIGGKSPAPSNKLRKTQTREKKSVLPSPLPQKPADSYPFPPTPPNTSASLTHYPPTNHLPGIGISVPTDYVPPPGFAHAELLPGHTVRLRMVTPGYLTWAPGQHFLISVPSITRFTTHPFTVASICDEQNQYDDGRVLVFLVRAKNGWTKDLWDTVAMMISRGQQSIPGESLPNCPMPRRGVLLRACVDGPYGSSVRASWGDYSSVLIVAGGSGVSYALSVLQYICLCMAGRDGRFLGGRRGGYGQQGYNTTRVRFVWLVREFGHIQWCAPVLRRCMDIISAPELQVDIFVTNVKPVVGPSPLVAPAGISFAPLPRNNKDGEFQPPKPSFVVDSGRLSRSSFSSEESGDDGDVDLSYYTGIVQDEGELGHEEHVLDYTNFEGDDDTALPGEAQFHLSIKNEGKSRRAVSRRMSMALFAKQELLHRASQMEYEGPSHSSVRLISRHSPLPQVDTDVAQSPRPSVDVSSSQRPSTDTASVRPDSEVTRASIHTQQTQHGFPSINPDSEDTRASVHHTHQNQSSFQSATTLVSPVPRTPTSAAPLMGSGPPSSFRDRGLPPLHTRSLSAVAAASPGHKRLSGHSQMSDRSFMRSPMTPASSMSRLSQWTDTDSFAALVPHGDVEAVKELLRLHLDEQEVEDVGIVAEHARPGKPKLDRILADEVERSKGALAVACCGPTSLDAMIRKVVAAQIDPQRVRRGDMRGSIALFSEEFSY